MDKVVGKQKSITTQAGKICRPFFYIYTHSLTLCVCERESGSMTTDTVSESFPMNGGDGTYSYTKNSEYQVLLPYIYHLLMVILQFLN